MEKAKGIDMSPLLQINELNFNLPNGRRILNNVHLTLYEGEFVILIGSNGSGKSSLFKIINQQYILKEGKIKFKNKNIKNTSKKELALGIITLSQIVGHSLFLDLSLLENARLIADIKNPQELKHYLNEFNQNLSTDLNKLVRQLSGGEQQQFMFALYISKKPDLLLLDEHTSALDPIASENIMQMTQQFVKKHRITCLMATHQPRFFNYGDRIIKMETGHIFDSKPQNAWV